MAFSGIVLLLIIPGTVALIITVILGIKALAKRAADKKERERLAAEMDAAAGAEVASDNPYMQKKETIKFKED